MILDKECFSRIIYYMSSSDRFRLTMVSKFFINLLRELKYDYIFIKTPSYKFINYIPNANYIDISYSNVVGCFNSINNIKEINAEECLFTKNDIYFLSISCRNLTSLNLSGCFGLTNYCLSYIFQYINRLTYFNISNTKISNDGLFYINFYGTKIDKLILSNCLDISDEAIRYLINSDTKELDLSCNPNITGNGFQFINTELRVLRLNDCPNIDNNALFIISNKDITDLYLRRNIMIDNTGISYISKLKVLDISDCINVNNETLKLLTDLEVLYIENTDINNYALFYLKKIKEIHINGCNYIGTIGMNLLNNFNSKYIKFYK